MCACMLEMTTVMNCSDAQYLVIFRKCTSELCSGTFVKFLNFIFNIKYVPVFFCKCKTNYVNLSFSDPTLTIENLHTALRGVTEWKTLATYLDVPVPKQRTKEAVLQDFIQNHPAPSWKPVVDFLFRVYIDGDWGKYDKLLQETKEKYIKGAKVIYHKWHGNVCILNYCSGPGIYLASYLMEGKAW